MLRLGTAVGALALLLSAVGVRAQTDFWIGDFPDDNASTASNWAGGSVPEGVTNGADTLFMSNIASADLIADQALDVLGISVEQRVEDEANFYIGGTSPIQVGSGGINLITAFDDGSVSLTIDAPLMLTATQTWTGGNITVNGTISGSGGVIFDSGYLFTLNNGGSTFTGPVTLAAYSSVILGASGHTLGYGSIDVNDGAGLYINAGSTITLTGAVQLGSGSNGSAINLGAYQEDDSVYSSLTFNSPVSVVGVEGEAYWKITNNSEVIFAGNLTGTGGETLSLGTPNTSGTAALTVLQGSLTGFSNINLTGQNSLIFDGSSVSQLTASGMTSIGTNQSRTDIYNGSYVGFGANYAGSIATALGVLLPTPAAQEVFKGALGLDTVTGATQTFSDTIDLTNFTSPYFIGLGSATSATLAGTLIPVGGAASEATTYYDFGGGGGVLTVTSALPDSTFDGNPAYGVQVLPGNAPLTVILSGLNSYHGPTYVDGAALIFDSPFNSSSLVVGQHSTALGYIGNTPNAGINDTSVQPFIDLFDPGSQGIAGFDNFYGTRTISSDIDLGSDPGLYLGTASNVTFTGTISPNESGYKFAGVKGGVVTVDSPIGGTTGLIIGLPTPIEYSGSISSVVIPNANLSFSGNTTLYSGILTVASGALGNGSLNIAGPADDGTGTYVGLRPSGNTTLGNDITVPYEGVHLNYAGSPYTLTLTGVISDTELDGKLIIDGPTVLANTSNSFDGGVVVNGTTLIMQTDGAMGDGGLKATSGSVITFQSSSPSVGYSGGVELDGATLTFSLAGGTPAINRLIMEAGATLNFANGSDAEIDFLQSDRSTDGNTINLGSGTSLFLSFDADPDFHGTITGVGSTIEVAGGSLNLSGTNTYSGGTMIDGSALVVASNNSALGTGPVTVYGTLGVNTGITLTNPLNLASGGTIAGYGTLSPGGTVTFGSNNTVVPGSANTGVSNLLLPPAGALTFGAGTSVVFGSYGAYNFAVTDATGAAGVGYSTLNVSGSLTINSNADEPFYLNLYSFAANQNGSPAQAANFSSGSAYTWTLVTATGGILNFSSDKFSISTDNFTNNLGTGMFTISATEDQLLLNFDPVPEPSTYALLGTGAGLVGLILWRRRPVPVR